jgi:hypothetical protein
LLGDPPLKKPIGLALGLALLVVAPAAADLVVPSQRVRSGVVLRETASRDSRALGGLRPGDAAEYLSSVPEWFHVRLENGTAGFVSRAWTQMIPDAPTGPAAVAPRSPPPGLLAAARSAVSSVFRWQPRVDFVIGDPHPRQTVYRHYDPNLPVAGFATPLGGDGSYDIMLVIDVSTSTNEYAETDVSRDGRRDDVWSGPDSILQAQIRAASQFVRTLKRLPRNHDGSRIHIGIVTFAGDERFRLRPEDARFDPTPQAIYALAKRDADTFLPLTRDYKAIQSQFQALSRTKPVGTTNFAAGIGKAIIELAGLEEQGARSRPRADSQKVILFLTDGKPRLPYDRFQAKRAALHAAKLAAKLDIRINAFALGKNAVTRTVNGAVKGMAHRSDGGFVELENPGDIVTILNATSFAYVEQVKLVNQTTDQETRYVTTGIDGSFYGEIPLEEGENEIEVIAMLHDRQKASETFTIEYRYGPPVREMLQQLEKIRGENEVLIEQIKERLAAEMETERSRKRLDLKLEEDPSY